MKRNYSTATGSLVRKCLLAIVLLMPAVALGTEPMGLPVKKVPDRQERITEAEKWLQGFRKLERQVPSLSPAENAWLKVEYDDELLTSGVYTNRALAASNSVEFQKRSARRTLDKMLPLLTVLSSTDSPPYAQELEEWTWFAVLMMDKQFWQAIDALRERKIVTGEINGVDKYIFENHSLWAQIVLTDVVIPMIRQLDR